IPSTGTISPRKAACFFKAEGRRIGCTALRSCICQTSVIAVVIALIARGGEDAAIAGTVAARFLAARGGRRSDDGTKQRAAGRADNRALGISTDGLADESAARAADKGAGRRPLLAFRLRATGKGHTHQHR